MNKECSEYSVDDNEKEEDSINSNEMLLNDNDEYQAGDVSIQMLRSEKASPHALKYSLFHFDDEDVNDETSESLGSTSLESGTSAPPSGEVRQTENHEIRKQKKVKRRILVSVGLLAVVMIAMVTTSGVTLPHAALLETRNVTSNRISSFLEPPFMLENTSLPALYELVIKYRINAELGDADAQYRLGLMHKSGRGAPQSDKEAVKWYKKAADQGYAIAQNSLGVMYFEGKGVNQSDKEAAKWYRKAAEQGYTKAQTNLGDMYQDGLGVPQSDEEAVKWYKKAVEQGDAIGQNSLGVMYQFGAGVPQSDEEAAKWFRKSAEQEVLLNKDLHLRNIAWALCIETDLVCHNQTEKLLNGTENQRNKDMHVRNTTWGTGKVYLSQMKKLSNGTNKLQNRDMLVLNLIWDICIGMGKVHLNLMKKL
uniref:Uncharacterized protein n=1 Tax=Plectus sambesii TaxID=2011161 RepID=A0A914XBB7_9BILA